jgi:hypothetical protein
LEEKLLPATFAAIFLGGLKRWRAFQGAFGCDGTWILVLASAFDNFDLEHNPSRVAADERETAVRDTRPCDQATSARGYGQPLTASR